MVKRSRSESPTVPDFVPPPPPPPVASTSKRVKVELNNGDVKPTLPLDVKPTIKKEAADVKPVIKVEADVKPKIEPIVDAGVKQEPRREEEEGRDIQPSRRREEGRVVEPTISAESSIPSEQNALLSFIQSAPPTLLQSLLLRAASLSTEFDSLLRSSVGQQLPSSPLVIANGSVSREMGVRDAGSTLSGTGLYVHDEEDDIVLPNDHRSDESALFIASLDVTVSEETLFDYFSVAGRVKSARISKTGPKYLHAYILFETRAEARAALDELETNARPLGSIPIVARFSTDPLAASGRPAFSSVFLKNLDISIASQDIITRFSQFGVVKMIRLAIQPLKKSDFGNPRHGGYVDFHLPSSAFRAQSVMNGTLFGSEILEVYVARPLTRVQPVKQQPKKKKKVSKSNVQPKEKINVKPVQDLKLPIGEAGTSVELPSSSFGRLHLAGYCDEGTGSDEEEAEDATADVSATGSSGFNPILSTLSALQPPPPPATFTPACPLLPSSSTSASASAKTPSSSIPIASGPKPKHQITEKARKRAAKKARLANSFEHDWLDETVEESVELHYD